MSPNKENQGAEAKQQGFARTTVKKKQKCANPGCKGKRETGSLGGEKNNGKGGKIARTTK